MAITKSTFDNTFIEKINHVDLTIGNDKTSTEFQSQVKIRIWDEDEIIFENENVKGISVLDKSVVTLSGTDYNEEWVRDGNLLRWKRIFKSNPTNNTYKFKLMGNWQDFNFLKQEPTHIPHPENITTFKKPGDEYGEDWERYVFVSGIDAGGREEWPRKIRGGYSVFHKTKRNNNYKTGKVFDILVPGLTGADGKTAYVEKLDIVNGYLEVTLPSKFMKTAKYPVTENATLGLTVLGATLITASNKNQCRFYAKTAGAETLAEESTIDNMQMGCSGGTGDEPCTVGIYPDSGGDTADGQNPIVESTERTILSTDAKDWYEFTTGGETLPAGDYWMALGHGQTNSEPNLYVTWTGGQCDYDAYTYSAGVLPTPAAVSGQVNTHIYSIFANVTATGGAGNAAIMTTNTGFWGATHG